MQEYRVGVLRHFTVIGQFAVLGRIIQQQRAVHCNEDVARGVRHIGRGSDEIKQGMQILNGGFKEICIQGVDAVYSIDSVRNLFQRSHTRLITAVPVHHQPEQVVGQLRIVLCRRLTGKHGFCVFNVLQGEISLSAALGHACLNFQRQDLVLVDIKRKVILERRRRVRSHVAFEVTLQPGCAGGVVRLVCENRSAQGCYHGKSQNNTEYFFHVVILSLPVGVYP